MVSNPEQWLEPMQKAGASQFCFHYEAVHEKGGEAAVRSLIEKVKNMGLKVGLAIKPKTDVRCTPNIFRQSFFFPSGFCRYPSRKSPRHGFGNDS